MVDLVAIAALGVINAAREHHGLDRITWDFPALSSDHKNRALEQGAGALNALRDAGYAIVTADQADPAKLAAAIAKEFVAAGLTVIPAVNQ
jgi:hypothetical protein